MFVPSLRRDGDMLMCYSIHYVCEAFVAFLELPLKGLGYHILNASRAQVFINALSFVYIFEM